MNCNMAKQINGGTLPEHRRAVHAQEKVDVA